MALSDYQRRLMSSQDSRGAPPLSTSLYGSGSGQGYYQSNNYNLAFQGLDSLQPMGSEGQGPNKNLAPNFHLGGVNTAQSSPHQLGTMGGLVRPRRASDLQVHPGQVDPALKQTIQSAGAGGIARGAEAFLGTGFQPWVKEVGPDGELKNTADAQGQYQQLRNLASAIGINASPYGDVNKGQGDMRTLYDLVNNATKDFYGVEGLSQGWSGNPNVRGAARTMYKDIGGGNLRPVTTPKHFLAEETSGEMLKGAVQDLSMVLPAFGGWAGLLGSGTAGTLSAGAGMGLTTGLGSAIGTGAANALVNAGMGAMASGSGGQGFLQSLLSQGMGAGVGSLTGGSNNLSNMFNTSGAGVSNLNPMGYYRDTMGRMGLGGSPLGMATRVPGYLNGLSRLFS